MSIFRNMRLKIFIYHNPDTEEPEKVYEFPWCEATSNEISLGGRNLFSKEPMKRPVLLITDTYLTEIKNQRYTVTESELFPNKHIKQQSESGQSEI